MADGPSRRRFLRAGIAAAAAGLGGCAGRSGSGSQPTGSGRTTAATDVPTADPGTADGTPGTADGTPGSGPGGSTASPTAGPPANGGLPVDLRTIAQGFEAPVAFAVPPGGPGHEYVADQPGRIYVRARDGVADEPFLDIAGDVTFGGERGLLGLAFHPAFAENRRFYVRYSAPPRSGTPSGYSHTFVLSEFRAAADGLRADPDSERTVLEIPEPQSNHNAGTIAFGPDGYLYVGVGDGGGGGDTGRGHVEDWYDANPGGNGQDVSENLLGSVLRIDVDAREDGTAYGIPDDNPLVGRGGLDEHYAWGFRNPWRLSFDSRGRLFVADVGQSRYEEVDLVVKGGNYGWNVREGAHCYRAEPCPRRTPGGEPLRDPIVEYSQAEDEDPGGASVIGGYVYEGDAIPALRGRYVFADYRADGRLFVAEPPDRGGQWSLELLDLVPGARGKLPSVLSFGRDRANELYVLTGGSTGAVHRLVPGG